MLATACEHTGTGSKWCPSSLATACERIGTSRDATCRYWLICPSSLATAYDRTQLLVDVLGLVGTDVVNVLHSIVSFRVACDILVLS
jgi:hypothetical protein